MKVSLIAAEKSEKLSAVEALIGSADFPPEYDDANYDPDYEFAVTVQRLFAY